MGVIVAALRAATALAAGTARADLTAPAGFGLIAWTTELVTSCVAAHAVIGEAMNMTSVSEVIASRFAHGDAVVTRCPPVIMVSRGRRLSGSCSSAVRYP